MKDVRRDLTAKQSYWLKHLESWRKSGRTMREYAAKHDLPLPYLYTWQSRLRQMGALVEDADVIPTKRTRRREVTFRAVRVIDPSDAAPTAALRIRFANGVVVELDGSGSRSPDTSLLSFLALLP